MSQLSLPNNPDNRTIRFGNLYFRYEDCLVTVGEYDQGDIESMDLKDLLELRKYINHKIY